MLEKLLNNIKVADPLVLLVVIPGNIIIVLALVVKLYPHITLTALRSNNYYSMVTVGILILILATFSSAVELYVGRGVVEWMNRRKSEREARRLIRNLPPLYKAILRRLMLDQNPSFEAYNPQISSALSDLERYGFIRCGTSIPRTYHVDIEYYAFFRENPGLLSDE